MSQDVVVHQRIATGELHDDAVLTLSLLGERDATDQQCEEEEELLHGAKVRWQSCAVCDLSHIGNVRDVIRRPPAGDNAFEPTGIHLQKHHMP